jgi:hypothetical protein
MLSHSTKESISEIHRALEVYGKLVLSFLQYRGILDLKAFEL